MSAWRRGVLLMLAVALGIGGLALIVFSGRLLAPPAPAKPRPSATAVQARQIVSSSVKATPAAAAGPFASAPARVATAVPPSFSPGPPVAVQQVAPPSPAKAAPAQVSASAAPAASPTPAASLPGSLVPASSAPSSGSIQDDLRNIQAEANALQGALGQASSSSAAVGTATPIPTAAPPVPPSA